MKIVKPFLLGILGVVLAGCVSSPDYGGVYDASSRGEMAPMAAAATKTRSSFAPEPEQGLGTEWGETRESAVRNVSFERESSRPADEGMLYYNDRSGVGAVPDTWLVNRRVYGKVGSDRGLVKWALVGPSGRTLRTRNIGGRYFVEGEKGERYSIVATNLTNERIEVVFSVDGLDVLDGRSASHRKRGYILGPKASIKVDGFRKSRTEVAAFRFSSVANSYAALKHGDTRNVGVVGLAVFREERRWSRADPFPGEFASPP